MYNQISKFFNVDAPTANGGGEPVSIASLMAKQGTMNNGEVGLSQPINITPEKKDEPQPSTEVAPVVTTTEPSKDEPAKSEAPSQEPEPQPSPTPQTAAEPLKVPTLQEVLKNQQPDAVLKELGYDDKMVQFISGLKDLDPKVLNFLNTWKNNGDLKSYLREWTTDYTKMSPEEVMRHQLQKEYPTASQQQLDVLFKREVVKAYSLDSEDEAEATEGRLLLEAKADKYRATLLQSQNDFLFPAAPEPKAPEPDKKEQEAQQTFEAIEKRITSNTTISNLYKNKSISVGDGDDKFTFPVEDSKEIVDGLLDILSDYAYAGKINKDTVEKITDEYVENQLLIGAFSKNPKHFLTEYAKHFKSIGGKSLNNLIENASDDRKENQPSPTQAAPTSPAEAMARGGRLVNP